MSSKEYDVFISDLEQYNQENVAPDSFTINEGHKNWRHYELGSCFGLVAHGDGHVMITEISEDDENWFCFSETDRNMYDSAHVTAKIKLYNRMQKWLDDNLTRGYYSHMENVPGFECGYRYFKSK